MPDQSKKKCDHSAVVFQPATSTIKCYRCNRVWHIGEIKEGIRLLETQPTLKELKDDILFLAEHIDTLNGILVELVKEIRDGEITPRKEST